MNFASSVETLELNSQGSREVVGISPGTYPTRTAAQREAFVPSIEKALHRRLSWAG